MVSGSVKIEIWQKKGIRDTPAPLFRLWVHTSFLGEDGFVSLSKNHLDGPHKDKLHRKFPQRFRVDLLFTDIHPPDSNNPPAWIGSLLHAKRRPTSRDPIADLERKQTLRLIPPKVKTAHQRIAFG